MAIKKDFVGVKSASSMRGQAAKLMAGLLFGFVAEGDVDGQVGLTLFCVMRGVKDATLHTSKS